MIAKAYPEPLDITDCKVQYNISIGARKSMSLQVWGYTPDAGAGDYF